MLYIKRIAATTTRGVFRVDPIDYPEADWLLPCGFLAALPALDDGEIIFTAGNPDELARIDDEYGVGDD